VVLRLRQPRTPRVQAPVDVRLGDLTLSLRSLDFRPTDMFDCVLMIKFAVEILCQYEVLPQVFEPAFECPFEHFGSWEAASLCLTTTDNCPLSAGSRHDSPTFVHFFPQMCG
jgi:hypothetical protein